MLYKDKINRRNYKGKLIEKYHAKLKFFKSLKDKQQTGK